MKRLAVAILTVLALAASAEARPRHQQSSPGWQNTFGREDDAGRWGYSYGNLPGADRRTGRQTVGGKPVGCPSKWCGCWLAHFLGKTRSGVNLNRARNWATIGTPTHARVGAVVVWPHHVGVITGRAGDKWVVKSGNDGNAVRERPRSVAGAIAFRAV